MRDRLTIRILEIRDLQPEDTQAVTIKGGYPLKIIYQKTGFGYRRYFRCPRCDCKCAKILQVKGYEAQLYCPKCFPLDRYRHRRNLYDNGGSSLIVWWMCKIAEKHGIPFTKTPFNLIDYLNKCPPGMRWRKYYAVLEKLHRMEVLRVIFNTFSIYGNRSLFGSRMYLSAGFIKAYTNTDWRLEMRH